METPSINLIEKIQQLLRDNGFTEVKADGDIGKITKAALEELDRRGDIESLQLQKLLTNDPAKRLKGAASFFAGPQDIRGFKHCKANGGTDNQCFKVGDNGRGYWGHDCTSTTIPMVALPREVWRAADKKGGDPVRVIYNGVSKDGIIGDTLPSIENLVDPQVVVDLNPAYAIAFGIDPEQMNNHKLSQVEVQFI